MSGMPRRVRTQPTTRLVPHNYGIYRGVNARYVQRTQKTVYGGLRSSLEMIGAVIAPITLFTAIGLYIGWRRTASYAQYFGIDQSVLQYSTQDYLLRSWQSANRVVFAVALGSIVVTVLHFGVKQLMLPERRRWLRLVELISYSIAGFSGVVLIVLAISSVVPAADLWISGIIRNIPYVTNRAIVALAAALLLYFGSSALRARNLQQRRFAIGQSAANTRVVTVLVVALLFLGLLSATDKYVSILGSVDAEYMAATLSDRQGVIVYSKTDLALPEEVSRTELTGPNQEYHYRYEGLRLYIRSADRYFLLPATWSKVDTNTAQAARLIVLRDDQSLRLEFLPGSK